MVPATTATRTKKHVPKRAADSTADAAHPQLAPTLGRIEEFFKTYKTDEGEEVKFACWFDRVTAIEKVKHALKAAKKHRK